MMDGQIIKFLLHIMVSNARIISDVNNWVLALFPYM